MPPGLIGFESGDLEKFDDSLNTGHIKIVAGSWWSGEHALRIDEAPDSTPTLIWREFVPSSATTLRLGFEFIGSSISGDSGFDTFVAKLLDPNSLAPFESIPELTSDQGNFLVVDKSGIRLTPTTKAEPVPAASVEPQYKLASAWGAVKAGLE